MNNKYLLLLLVLGFMGLFSYYYHSTTYSSTNANLSNKSNNKQSPTSQQLNKTKKYRNKLEKKQAPYDYLGFVRSYPDFNMDIAAYQKGVEKAHQQNALAVKSNGYEEPWQLEGPTNIGGRINVVIGEPGNADVLYVGCSKGGVFKTTDGGENWYAIFDDQPFLAIADIQIHPNDVNTIFVATGDPNISGYFTIGDGVYKSTDGGETWQNLGLAQGYIATKIRINYNNPDIIYVGCMGNPQEENGDRGVYKTVDGGETWTMVLPTGNDAGIIDMVMHPTNPDILYAASWNRLRNSEMSVTFGDNAIVYKTEDGGLSWPMMDEGLPNEPMSRIGLSISQNNPEKVYALYVDTLHQLHQVYHTANNGDSWAMLSDTLDYPENALGGFGWYFGKIVLNPYNDEEVYVLGVDMHRTNNGGNSWENVTNAFNVHADKHSLFFIDETTLVLATDGGLYKSTDSGENWEDIENLPNTQFYRVTYNPHNIGMYAGGTQDNGTLVGNVDSLNNWDRIYGGDGFTISYHPTNPDIVIAEWQNGGLVISNDGGDSFNDFAWGFVEDRRNWDMPYIISKDTDEPLRVFAGTYRILENTSGNGDEWTPISEALTDSVVFGDRYHTLTIINQSVINTDYLYVGSSDGNVHRSLDRGASWEKINNELPDKYVTSVVPSPNEVNTVYATLSGFKGEGIEPYVFRSENNGDTWENISGDLPEIGGINDILVLPNTQNDSLLFVGTDLGVYASSDLGATWQRLGEGMPFVAVFDIEYEPTEHRLIAGTFARSMYSYPVDSIVDFGPSVVLSVEGVTNKNISTHIKVYPNPAKELITVEVKNTANGQLPTKELWIKNVQGQVVQKLSSLQNTQQVNISQLSKGTYFICTPNNDKQYLQQFVKY